MNYFDKFKIENLMHDFVYVVAGSIINVWFQSLTDFWDYQTSFIEGYLDIKAIYLILFFGISFVVALAVRSVGDTLLILIIKFLFPKGDTRFSKYFYGSGKITTCYNWVADKITLLLVGKNLATYRSLPFEDYFESRVVIKKEFEFKFERFQTRVLGHRIIIGFLYVYLFTLICVLHKANLSSLIVLILLFLSISNALKINVEIQEILPKMKELPREVVNPI